LTYADISAVNPTAMTPWRSSHLWQLYMAVYNELTRELESGRIEDPAAETPERAGFLAGFPKRYLRTHTSEEIAAHMALEEHSRKRGAAVDVQKLDAAWRFTFAAPDRPGLFASAAGTLSSFGLNILRAEAFSNKRGLVLDSFTFSDPLRNLELNPTEVDRLRSVGERVLAGRADVTQLLRSRPKPALPSRRASLPPAVTFDSNASRSATLVEIVAADRPGLLYNLASALSSFGCNIEVVLIDTEAHKAIDVFYVTTQGRKLTEEELQPLGEALRCAAE
jgi:[protein-PII] uridylyltransferase